MEELTKRLLWIPAAIPPFPNPEKIISKAKSRSEELLSFAYWDYFKLTETRDSPYDISVWRKEIIEEFPEIVEWGKNLPIQTIRNIKINFQDTIVSDHIDFVNARKNIELWKNNKQNEPCGYRTIISGTRNNKFYIKNSIGEKIYCTLPEDTDTYILRFTDLVHGVDLDPGRANVYIHIEIDPVSHNIVLENSLRKYRDYAIFE
jgi:hypothetical protein